jgi:hypothetical protein
VNNVVNRLTGFSAGSQLGEQRAKDADSTRLAASASAGIVVCGVIDKAAAHP